MKLHRALLILLALLLWSPASSSAQYVVTDFDDTTPRTRYVCQLEKSHGEIALFKRTFPGSTDWISTRYAETVFENVNERRRWRSLYLRRKARYGSADLLTRRPRRRWKVSKKIIQQLDNCSTTAALNTTDACSEIADGKRLQTRIINGDKCRTGNSSVVMLRMRRGFGASTCSGTVIGPHTVATAAHCVSGKFNAIDIITATKTIRASSHLLHPGYDDKTFFNLEAYDIALVYTDEELTTEISPVISETPSVGTQSIIAGYGLTEDDTFGDLRAAISLITFTDEDTIAVRYDGRVNQSNPCFGDSGGPLFVSRNGQWTLAGITSNGDLNNCGVGDVTRFVNVAQEIVQLFIFHNLK